MTHNLCVECESVCGMRRVRVLLALMQCFPTLPLSFALPSLITPSPYSLLCAVDDSDPGQSSETWGERLVPPCRIYAGNRCSLNLSPVSSSNHVTHFSLQCAVATHTHTHMHVCVFFALYLPLLQLTHVCL